MLKQHGVMRRSELSAAGVHPETLARLVEEGSLIRVARGLYQLADAEITAPHAMAEVTKLVPSGVVCLISALQFHDLTLQMPSRVWVAIGAKARKPKFEYPAIRAVRFGSRALSLGVEVHRIDGVSVPIFNPAKTVVDCFRFRRARRFRRGARGPAQRNEVGEGQTGGDCSTRAGDAHLVRSAALP